MTCARTQEFLAKNKIETAQVADAKKQKKGPEEALALAANADILYATKGKKVVRLDLKKDKPAKEELLALMIGPSGNLRAPTVIKGKTLIVGFDEQTFSELFSKCEPRP